MDQKNRKNTIIGLGVILVIYMVFSFLFKKQNPPLVQSLDDTLPIPTHSVCESARETLFSYQLTNPEIEEYQTKKGGSDYITVKNLKDYFFANGVRQTPGGYEWEMEEMDNSCKIKVLLVDDDSDKSNPEWSVGGSVISCINTSGCKLTPELER